MTLTKPPEHFIKHRLILHMINLCTKQNIKCVASLIPKIWWDPKTGDPDHATMTMTKNVASVYHLGFKTASRPPKSLPQFHLATLVLGVNA